MQQQRNRNVAAETINIVLVIWRGSMGHFSHSTLDIGRLVEEKESVNQLAWWCGPQNHLQNTTALEKVLRRIPNWCKLFGGGSQWTVTWCLRLFGCWWCCEGMNRKGFEFGLADQVNDGWLQNNVETVKLQIMFAKEGIKSILDEIVSNTQSNDYFLANGFHLYLVSSTGTGVRWRKLIPGSKWKVGMLNWRM